MPRGVYDRRHLVRTVKQRAWSKLGLPDESGCMNWLGALDAAGYGRISADGTMAYAHRVVYELLVGPIPEGLQIDHLCRNRACSAPDHLEPVTQQVNILRGAIPSRPTCSHGHEWTQENTYWRKDRPATRQCRACRNIRRREISGRKKARV